MFQVLDCSILNLLPGLAVGAVGDHVLVESGLSGECLATMFAGQLGQNCGLIFIRLIHGNIFILKMSLQYVTIVNTDMGIKLFDNDCNQIHRMYHSLIASKPYK